MILRSLTSTLLQKLDTKKAIIILGPRQSGKTTLVKAFASELGQGFTYVNADDPVTRTLWRPENMQTVTQLIGKNQLVIIDEAQALENGGLLVKILIDKESDCKFIITGSSALELANQTYESLTGRYRGYNLLPVSVQELRNTYGLQYCIENLSHHLVFGSYPEVVTNSSEALEVITNISQSYLYKDILALTGMRKPQILDNLLKALSWQVGSQVSYHELSRTLGIDVKTVDKYISILEKNFIVFTLPSFARNLRNELQRSKKIYFYDNGIRNSVINNFSPLALRDDTGALWENYLMAERRKMLNSRNIPANSYFWRTTSQVEIDYIEEVNGKVSTYEFKYNQGKTVKFASSFLDTYHPHEAKVIHKDNFWDWLSISE